MHIMRNVLAIAALCLLVLAGCSSDSDDASESGTPSNGSDPEQGASQPGGNQAAGGGGGEGSLTLAGEEITLGPGRCFLEEQPSAGGGGTIELTGQASGTNAAGDEVVIDFTRYSDDSDFAGDDVSITIGDPFSEDATTLYGDADSGAVSLDGSVLSASDFPVEGDSISFEIAC